MRRTVALAILMLLGSLGGSAFLGDEVLYWATGFYHSSGRIPKPLLGAIAGAFIGLFIELACRTTENRFRFGRRDVLGMCLLFAIAYIVLTMAARYAVNYSW